MYRWEARPFGDGERHVLVDPESPDSIWGDIVPTTDGGWLAYRPRGRGRFQSLEAAERSVEFWQGIDPSEVDG